MPQKWVSLGNIILCKYRACVSAPVWAPRIEWDRPPWLRPANQGSYLFPEFTHHRHILGLVIDENQPIHAVLHDRLPSWWSAANRRPCTWSTWRSSCRRRHARPPTMMKSCRCSWRRSVDGVVCAGETVWVGSPPSWASTGCTRGRHGRRARSSRNLRLIDWSINWRTINQT